MAGNRGIIVKLIGGQFGSWILRSPPSTTYQKLADIEKIITDKYSQ